MFTVIQYLCLGFSNMSLLKQELAIQVANVNGIQVNLNKQDGTVNYH